jgi:2-aminoadipate transaminase
MKRSFIREILESIDDETISFAGGLPSEELFPLKDLKEANKRVYSNASNLQYSRSNGLLELREEIADFYTRDGFITNAENILITTGSQQALYIIAHYFKNKKILIEEPSYLGAVNIFKMNDLKMQGVKLYTDGIDVEYFQNLYKYIKLAYLIPDFQNPMNSLYSQNKREEIAKIVLQNDGYIIEDAPYSELYFTQKQHSISSLIPRNSFHLGSFSKTLSPSLRLGWIRADNEILKEFIKIKETIDLHSCSLAQYTLKYYLQDKGKYNKHLENLRRVYKDKMYFFAEALEKYLPAFRFVLPEGGMFIYGSIKGIDTFKLVQECMKEKVVFVPANQFYFDKNISDEIRFNFTHSSKNEIIIGLQKIAAIYKDIKC